jgi:hypothetical protein
MRYLLLVLPLSLLAGCYYPYGYGGYYPYGYGGYYGYSTPYAPGYSQSYAPAYQPAYQSNYAPQTYAPANQAARSSYSGENCGTPDNFRPCPPLPRHPLPYYPGDRY